MKLNFKLIKIIALVGTAPALFMYFGELIIGNVSLSWMGLVYFIISCVVSSFYTVCIASVVTLVWNKINTILPIDKGLVKRYLVQLGVTNVVAVATMILLTYLTLLVVPNYRPVAEVYQQNILITIVMDTFCITISELYFYFNEWRNSLIEKERLEKENIQSQFQSLKNQVNPHFLFNSLNTLSALIHSDPDQAEEFIDEFAKVYRYILEFDDKHLVTINEELNFIQSYVFLQQIRFGKNLAVKISIDDSFYDHFIPPLSLQILVENAIKHNVISQEMPLTIVIYVDGDNIRVENNLQQRMDKPISTGVGLRNIKSRYELFAGKTPILIKQTMHLLLAFQS